MKDLYCMLERGTTCFWLYGADCVGLCGGESG